MEMGSYDTWSFVSLHQVVKVIRCVSRGLGSHSFSRLSTVGVAGTARFVLCSPSVDMGCLYFGDVNKKCCCDVCVNTSVCK